MDVSKTQYLPCGRLYLGRETHLHTADCHLGYSEILAVIQAFRTLAGAKSTRGIPFFQDSSVKELIQTCMGIKNQRGSKDYQRQR